MVYIFEVHFVVVTFQSQAYLFLLSLIQFSTVTREEMATNQPLGGLFEKMPEPATSTSSAISFSLKEGSTIPPSTAGKDDETAIVGAGEERTSREEKENGQYVERKNEYLTGFRLIAVLLGVGMVVFLIMLDQTIVVTVSSSRFR